MAQPLSSHDLTTIPRPAGRLRAVLLWGGAILGTIVLLAALALWLRYGTAVFFDMIAAGFAACF
jgi:hypothetical protein